MTSSNTNSHSRSLLSSSLPIAPKLNVDQIYNNNNSNSNTFRDNYDENYYSSKKNNNNDRYNYDNNHNYQSDGGKSLGPLTSKHVRTVFQ